MTGSIADIPDDAVLVLPQLTGREFRYLLFSLASAQILCAIGRNTGVMYYIIGDLSRFLEREWRYLQDAG